VNAEDLLEKRARARIGTSLLGKYFLDRVLGVGGMAAVFAANHRNGSRVAVKVLHAEYAMVDDVRVRFLREGYVANRIAHPGVVKVLDDDTGEDGSVFLVLELLEGETLDELWQRQGARLPPEQVLLHADRTLDVLHVAHASGIVHRDIKPENLFLTRDGQLKVLDFGIARLLDGTGATQSGQSFGTPAFMPPEQAAGRMKDVDARTDIWSVGATMFALLSGSFVHEGTSFVAAAVGRARPVRTVAPWVPADVGDIVDVALAFEQEKRWPTARSMQAAMRATGRYDPAKDPIASGAAAAPPGPIGVGGSFPTLPLGSMPTEPHLLRQRKKRD
jgi:serine/threonine protein kinase